mmetsp:Transcript_89335/g.186688  ORF Transcript_89335/g.186688 Transcript_89335/m.186688 type:complete len:112 (-) Transcript_89335:1680-2015(-)
MANSNFITWQSAATAADGSLLLCVSDAASLVRFVCGWYHESCCTEQHRRIAAVGKPGCLEYLANLVCFSFGFCFGLRFSFSICFRSMAIPGSSDLLVACRVRILPIHFPDR